MAYGFRFLNADGSVALDMQSAPMRVVFQQRFAADFEGTVSIPNFNSDQGAILVKPCAMKVEPFLGNQYLIRTSDSAPLQQIKREFGYFHTMNPDLSWDNASKILTISKGSAFTYYSNHDPFVVYLTVPDYLVIAIAAELVQG